LAKILVREDVGPLRVGPLDNVDRCSQRNGYRHRAALSDIAPRFQPKRVTEQCSQPPMQQCQCVHLFFISADFTGRNDREQLDARSKKAAFA